MHMTARLWCFAFVGSVALVGCGEYQSTGSDGRDLTGGSQGGSTGESAQSSGGTKGGTSVLDIGGTIATVSSIKNLKVGDTVQPSGSSPSSKPGKVTSITVARDQYYYAEITYPSEWTCPTNPYLTTASTPAATPTNPTLSGTSCAGLGALRGAGLKAQAYSTLLNSADSVLREKCTPPQERRCFDSQGHEVDSSKCYYYSGGYGGSSGWAGGSSSSSRSSSSSPSGAGGSKTASGSGATDYSTTNTQVQDVDEADFVKNDANDIFVLSSDGLHIINAWPAAQTHQLTTIKLTGEPRRLFLDGNRLVVYTRLSNVQGSSGAGTSNPSAQGCTYGYGCRFSSEGGHTMAAVFDVSDPSNPRELIRYQMSGGYVASRRIGSTVYTVVSDTGAPQVPGLDYDVTAASYDQLTPAIAKKKAANDAIIDGADNAYFLPWTRRVTPDGKISIDDSCNHALASAGAQGTSFVSVLAFDLDKLDPMTRTILGSSPGYVYASASSLYLAVDQTPELDYSTNSYYYGERATNTAVHKFALSGTDTRYVASVTLPGHILNEFAMDEYEGVLRVASTLGWVPDSNVSSFLTTFGEKDGKLVKLGQVGGIAPTEDIRSVRFDGKRGYVVTFKKTDPLFVFDLSDASAPKLMGELKIPGFSTYMHPLDASHILAVGFDADDQGSYAYFNGIQIQIFDVSTLSAPKLQSKLSVGTRGSGSDALTNHLAFNYFPSRNMLALPLTICEGGGNGTFGDKLTFTGLMAFDISLETGIKEHGRLPFVDPAKASSSVSCGNWWTDTSSLVKRSIFMDDWVYGISDTQLKVASLDNMSTVLQTVSLIGQ